MKKVSLIFVASIGTILKYRFNYMSGYRKLWDAKKKVMAMVFGDWVKSYALLLKWLRAVEEFNLNSWIKFISTPTDHPSCAIFNRVFWAFAPSIEGFKYYRLMISIDATFLYKSIERR